MIKFPDVLYKYRDADNQFHIQTLEERYVFIPSPLEFNDPFDCRMPMDFESVADDLNLQILFAQKLATLSRIAVDKKNEFMNSILSTGKLRDKKFLQSFEQIQIEEMVGNVGIFCLSKEPSNLLLWSHYANSHKGFCIGYDPKVVLEVLGYPTMGPVNYCNIYPLLSAVEDPDKTSYTQIFHKSIDWYYEKEYRYVKPNSANQKFEIPNEAITEIYLGCMISDTNETIIKKIKNQNYPNAKLYKYLKSTNKFEMELTQIV